MITQEQIRKRIAEEIGRSGMTQKQLAACLQVSQQTISAYRCGSKLPALDTFANLCTALDGDPADLLGLKD